MDHTPVAPEYVLGRSGWESQRLIKQSSIFRPLTERIFRRAGLGPGMRVLDLGCGAGDVSFLAAELVGPTGSVVGIDRDPGVLAVARQRAEEMGLATVSFEERSIEDFHASEPFDAVVGRFVLFYQPDPATTLGHVRGLLRAGGIVAVIEPDLSIGVRSCPHVALWQQVSDWICETFRRGGAHHDIGARLYPVFQRAGLPGPSMRHDVLIGGGEALRPVVRALHRHDPQPPAADGAARHRHGRGRAGGHAGGAVGARDRRRREPDHLSDRRGGVDVQGLTRDAGNLRRCFHFAGLSDVPAAGGFLRKGLGLSSIFLIDWR